MANRRGGHAKKIDTVHWTLSSSVGFIGQAAGAVAALFASAQHLPETLLRMRGEWIATFNGALPDGEGVQIVCGIIQVPEGTGTTVLWDPLIDGDAPWIWWDVANLIYHEYVVDAVQSVQTSSMRRVIDSKAMRKLRNTELQFVMNQQTITGLSASNVDVVALARLLAGS